MAIPLKSITFYIAMDFLTVVKSIYLVIREVYMIRKTAVSFFIILGVVISTSGMAFADLPNIFSADREYYEWSFNSNSGELTIDALYASDANLYDNYNFSYYDDIASSVTSMTINSIHYSYDAEAPYDFSVNKKLANLKTITVNSSCSDLYNLGYCPSLQKITFNNNKTRKTYLDFYRGNLTSLPTITYDKNNTSDYFLYFAACNGDNLIIPASYGNDTHIKYSFASAYMRSVSFASGTKTIPAYAFAYCGSLNTVTIPSGVTTIDDGAFYCCDRLQEIAIPESVKSIYYNAFYRSEITNISYGGSREQWFASITGKDVLYLDSATVQCKDGDIIIKKTVSGNKAEYVQYPLGWYKKDNKWYYYENDGTLIKDCMKELGGFTYCFDSNGIMVTGWYKNNGKTFYFDPSTGAMKTNCWKSDNSKWYYLGPEGSALTGWQMIDKIWYYLGSDGVMVTGKKQINGSWYYFNSKGAMQTGWQEINGAWYYFNSIGAMQTGWKYISVAWYYFDENGIMLTGWQKTGDFWYYLGSSGAMVKGWKQINGSWYHFNEDGIMATGTRVIDGKTYHFDSNGVWLGY